MDPDVRHPSPPPGHRLRHPSQDDAAAVAALKRAVDVSRHGDSDVTVELVREEWALPRLDLARDAWVVEDAGGRLVGYAICWLEALPADIVAEEFVDPAARGRGLGALLLDLCEARSAELYRAAATDEDGVLGVPVHETDVRWIRMYEDRGYERVRAFLRLDRDLSAPVEEPLWPAGVRIATFREGRDEERVHAAAEEAFRDHFRPSQMDLDEWREFRFSREDLDLGLWFVAWDGEEVAGSVLAFETPLGGYLDELSVRRPWRGRGLGRALLLHACVELRRRGHPVAYLGVDSENPTGAMHLYGSAGFRPTRGAVYLYEKKLRGS